MCTGKADAQKLYFGGQLKISGNVMASQKLEFLKKMDPERAKVAVAEARAKGGGGGAAAAATTTSAAKGPQAPGIFAKLAERLAKTPALAGEVKGTLLFKLKSPDAAWLADLREGSPAVRQGVEKADATLTLTDEDLGVLASGSETAQQLHQKGRLRIDGDVRLAHRLGFLKGLA